MFGRIIKYLGLFFLLIIIFMIIINSMVIGSTRDKILTEKSIAKIKDVDCILILGAGIWGNYPTPMLEDRLKTGITLYENKVSKKLLVSGDHIQENHDEVNVMKDYLVGHLIPSQDVFMDHAGISTYDSVYRAKEIFQAQKIVIVTQKYHLYRALYIADQLDLEAYGVASNQQNYTGQEVREIREFLARIKDVIKSILKPTSTYLGETISITGNGDITNDSIKVNEEE